MYSKNDYRYYLEHRLLVSDDYLAHYGVIGMKWGIRQDKRRASLSTKRSKNDAKIAKYETKLNTVGAKKRDARAAKYQVRQAKYDRAAATARKRMAKGKKLSHRQMKKIIRAESLRERAAKNSKYNDNLRMKISSLQSKNTKIDKKIAKMDKPSRAGARAYQKGLNNLDKKLVKDLYTSKVSQNQKKASKAAERYKSNTSEIKKTAADAKRRGYDVSSKSTKRSASNSQAAVSMLMGPAAGAGYQMARDKYTKDKYGVTSVMDGTKYTVRKPKKRG